MALETLETSEMLKRAFRDRIQNGNTDGYAKYLRGMKDMMPGEFADIQRANTLAKNEMLDQIQFYGMDEYAGDPRSIKGMEGMEYRSQIPFGSETENILKPDGGQARGLAFPDKQMYFSGNAPKGVYRHEAWHTGGPQIENEEYTNLRYDQVYANAQGNQAAENNAVRRMNNMNVSQEVDQQASNYMYNAYLQGQK